MKTLDYLGKVWIQVRPKDVANNDVAYLTFLGEHYYEVSAYFKEFYGLEIEFPKIVEDEDSKYLQFHVKHRIYADTLSIFSGDTIIEVGNLGEHETGLSIPTIKITTLL